MLFKCIHLGSDFSSLYNVHVCVLNVYVVILIIVINIKILKHDFAQNTTFRIYKSAQNLIFLFFVQFNNILQYGMNKYVQKIFKNFLTFVYLHVTLTELRTEWLTSARLVGTRHFSSMFL